MPKREASSDLPEIDIRDVLDYAYCGLLVWWRRFAPEAEREDSLSADDLMRVAVQETIRQMYSKKGTPPAEILGKIWGTWLKKWGATDIHRELADFATKYRKLNEDFSEKGNYRRRDGTLYVKPSWSAAWKEQYVARGLSVLQNQINEQQHLAGLPKVDSYQQKDSRFPHPLGLAEAYALSLLVVSHLDLFPASVLGIRIRLVTDLPTIRIRSTADLVTPIGIAKKPGRPSETNKHEQQVVQYELHLYDESEPNPEVLFRDYRVLSLFHAHPPEMAAESIRNHSVLARIMRTGKYQVLTARGEGGLLGLETAARMAFQGIRAGVFIPRSLVGAEACGDCIMRPRCLVGEGILERLTLNVPENLEASSQFVNFLHKQFDGKKKKEDLLLATEEMFRWLTRNPSITMEQAQWILHSYLASQKE